MKDVKHKLTQISGAVWHRIFQERLFARPDAHVGLPHQRTALRALGFQELNPSAERLDTAGQAAAGGTVPTK